MDLSKEQGLSPKKPICWSPLPAKEYTTIVNGARIGIGLHPGITSAPGAWNLLWITSSVLDKLPHWSNDASGFPYSTMATPIAIGAAWQAYEEGKPTLIGELANTMTPHKFLDLLENHREFLLPLVYGKKAWFDLARGRADLYQEANTKVISVNFQRGVRHASS